METAIRFTLGLNVGGFEPNAKRAEKALADVGKAGQVSAGQIAAATRGLPAQFTDIATSLAGGQNPFLVLLQQGGQIKDQFGSIGGALRGIASTITPVTVGIGAAVAGVGALVAGFVQGSNESSRLRDNLLLTGNAAGLTASRMDGLANSVTAASLQTVAGSREIIAALSATGQTSDRVIEGQAKVVARIADLSGKAGKELAASFSGQLEGPARFAAKLNESYNFLSVAQFKRIQQLVAEGKATDAVTLTNETLLKSLDKQRQNLGTLESAWGAVGRKASEAWDFMLGLGREQSTIAKIEALRSQIGSILKSAGGNEPGAGTFSAGRIQSLRQQIQLLAEQAKQESAAAAQASEDAAKNRKGIDELVNAKPGYPLSAIRTGREQYRADFLRSEKAFYAELEEQEKKAGEAAIKRLADEQAALKDLDKGIADNEKRRLSAATTLLESLSDANARASAELIVDERARAEALIAIEREASVRRIRLAQLTAEESARAMGLVNETANSALLSLNQQIARQLDTARQESTDSMAESISSGILEGFRRGNTFADVFANELKAQFSKIILTPIIRPAVEAGNDALQSLLRGISGAIFGQPVSLGTATGSDVSQFWDMGSLPGRARGGPVQAGGAYLVGERGVEVLQMGDQGGNVVPNHALGGVTLSPQLSIHIDARSDQAQVTQLVASGVQQGMRQTMEQLRLMGVVG